MSEQPIYPQDPFSPIKPDQKAPDSVSSPRESTLQHARSDVDSSELAQHHTLGMKRNQAASGAHTHNGSDSNKLGKGAALSITGKLTPTTVAEVDAIIDSMVTMLSKVIDFTDGRT